MPERYGKSLLFGNAEGKVMPQRPLDIEYYIIKMDLN
jgi:hypothetical protein